MIQASITQRQVPVYTYWYLLYDHDIKDIQREGLKPIDLLSAEQQEHYRTPKLSPQEYWRDRYDLFYKHVLKKPYRHYGIYTTPIDLPHHSQGGPHCRVRFEITELLPLAVLHCLDLGILELATETNVTVAQQSYTSAKIKTVWTTVKQRRFRFLPQVVYFGDVPLKFTSSQIQPW